MSAENNNFQFGIERVPDLFSDIKPNLGYNLKRDGPLSKHRPSIFEKRLDDISLKYMFVHMSNKNIEKLLSKIAEKYDKSKNELIVADEYWELTMFVSYLFVEARSILDIFAKLNLLLYPKSNLPHSFNEFSKSKTHLSKIINSAYFGCLKKVIESGWINHLMTYDRSIKKSIRDTQVHDSQLSIRILPNKDMEIEFFVLIHGALDVDSISLIDKQIKLPNVSRSILTGLFELISGFRNSFTRKDILEILC